MTARKRRGQGLGSKRLLTKEERERRERSEHREDVKLAKQRIKDYTRREPRLLARELPGYHRRPLLTVAGLLCTSVKSNALHQVGGFQLGQGVRIREKRSSL